MSWHPCWSNVLMSPQPDRTYDLKIGRPTVSYFLKQAAGIAKGAGKTGEMLCRSDVSALAPVFTRRAHPVKDTRLSAGSVWAPPWLMLYSWRGGTAAVGSGLFTKRELWISTFGALSNLQPHFSRWFLRPPPHWASPGHICPALSSPLPLFYVQRPRDGGDGVGKGRVWDRPGESPGWVLQNEEHTAGNGGQKHHRPGPIPGH